MTKTKESPTIELQRYREQIQDITRSILDLSLKRQVVSSEIAGIKETHEKKIEDTEVEKRLVSAMTDYAKSIGLNEDLAQNIVFDLIRFSKISQSEKINKNKIRAFVKSQGIGTVTVVGAGRMGGWLAEYFHDLGVEVFLFDEIEEKAKVRAEELQVGHFRSLENAIDSDLIIISVPITKTTSLIREILKAGRDNSFRNLRIIEISSVKNEIGTSGLFEGFSGGEGAKLYSIHPLFGSQAQPYERNSIIQVFPKDTSFLEGIFPQSHLVFLDWKDHDRLMGTFLTLPHALALIFAELIESPEKFGNSLKDLDGPSYSRMLELSKRTLSEDPDVYFEIQATNPNSSVMIKDLLTSVANFQKILANRSDFANYFNQVKDKTAQ